jgi:hypothetical protein
MTDQRVGPESGASIANAMAGLTSIISEQSQQLRALTKRIESLADDNAALVQTVADLRRHVRPDTAETRKADRLALEKRAVELIDICGPVRTRIAEKMGVSPEAMKRWPLFSAALRGAKAKSAPAKQDYEDFSQGGFNDDD